jgi:hypothetical protein
MKSDEDDSRALDIDEIKAREAGLDETIAQSFPASDPASTIPNPREPQLVDLSEGSDDDSDDPPCRGAHQRS